MAREIRRLGCRRSRRGTRRAGHRGRRLSAQPVDAARPRRSKRSFSTSASTTFVQQGDVLPGDLEGHDISASTTASRSLAFADAHQADPDDFFTASPLSRRGQFPAFALYGYPGQDLVWPGEFVIRLSAHESGSSDARPAEPAIPRLDAQRFLPRLPAASRQDVHGFLARRCGRRPSACRNCPVSKGSTMSHSRQNSSADGRAARRRPNARMRQSRSSAKPIAPTITSASIPIPPHLKLRNGIRMVLPRLQPIRSGSDVRSRRISARSTPATRRRTSAGAPPPTIGAFFASACRTARRQGTGTLTPSRRTRSRPLVSQHPDLDRGAIRVPSSALDQ